MSRRSLQTSVRLAPSKAAASRSSASSDEPSAAGRPRRGTAGAIVFASPTGCHSSCRPEFPKAAGWRFRRRRCRRERRHRAGVDDRDRLHQVDNPVIDRSGNVYLTYSGTRGQQVPVSIFRVGPNGTRETFSSAVVNPTSMALDADGRLYVSSRFEGVVYRLAEDGSAEPFATELGMACGLAFAPDGTLFVGDRSGTIFSVDSIGQATVFASLPSSVAAFHLALGPDALYVTGPTLSTTTSSTGSIRRRVDIFSHAFGRPQGLRSDRRARCSSSKRWQERADSIGSGGRRAGTRGRRRRTGRPGVRSARRDGRLLERHRVPVSELA